MTHFGVGDPQARSAEAELVARLRAGDEAAFEALVALHHGLMLAVARSHVKSRAVAEEVVQEAWLGFLQSLGTFEGRSSLKTWIVSILVHKAKTRAVREARSVPFSSLAPDGEEPAVDPARFRGPDEPYPGHWRAFPGRWHEAPEDAALGRETLEATLRAIDGLPATQRAVIAMRDVAGCSAEEACATLELSEGNQRVLLHRARSRVRAELERHFDPGVTPGPAGGLD